jgi:hypothetical protein
MGQGQQHKVEVNYDNNKPDNKPDNGEKKRQMIVDPDTGLKFMDYQMYDWLKTQCALFAQSEANRFRIHNLWQKPVNNANQNARVFTTAFWTCMNLSIPKHQCK